MGIQKSLLALAFVTIVSADDVRAAAVWDIGYKDGWNYGSVKTEIPAGGVRIPASLVFYCKADSCIWKVIIAAAECQAGDRFRLRMRLLEPIRGDLEDFSAATCEGTFQAPGKAMTRGVYRINDSALFTKRLLAGDPSLIQVVLSGDVDMRFDTSGARRTISRAESR